MKALAEALARARLPAVLVEISTPHAAAAPQFLHTTYGSARVVAGAQRLKWSDGHTE